ncbi:hypothetical protein [uncultured Kordia sp.]|uniref:hypothetical protein n=1 Tax=uncultured Kordia sp. TaxID=507699 RepID=UPI0026086862|nr:hypothetical protein [uncultured Kordia sp.]
MNLSIYISKKNVLGLVAVVMITMNTSCTKEPLNEYDDDCQTHEVYECDHTDDDGCCPIHCGYTAIEGEDPKIDPDDDDDNE